MPRIAIVAFVLLIATFGAAAPARAAGALDDCDGVVTTVPYDITTSGHWCMDRDLTSIAQSIAIEIIADNVVLDCAQHTLENRYVPTQEGTTRGIHSTSRSHVTVRNCNVVGFDVGITVNSGSSQVVEDNRVAAGGGIGIQVISSSVGNHASVVRGNHIVGIRSRTVKHPPRAILASGDVDILDNTIAGVAGIDGLDAVVLGIYKMNPGGGDISGNRVRGLVPSGTRTAWAIFTKNVEHSALRGNDVSGDGSANTVGIHCGGTANRLRDNVVHGFPVAFEGCGDAGGNDVSP